MESASKKQLVIGIDLGTTYCCVSIYRNGRAEIIPNSEGENTTPSYVCFLDNERLVGKLAKNKATRYLKNTVFDSKRLIGKKFYDSKIQNDLKYWPFKVQSGPNDNPKIVVTINKEEKRFSP